ncbi:MAG: hypothetical protein H7833_03020 [Magnetococcus sp. DMHC-1]
MIASTNPAHMTTEERLTEVAAILAAGVRRVLKLRKTEKIPLDKSPRTRPHVRKKQPNGERA